jgi:hypothetical protein
MRGRGDSIRLGLRHDGGAARLARGKCHLAVDLMFAACGETYESLLPFEVRIDLDGVVSSNRKPQKRAAEYRRERDAVALVGRLTPVSSL